MNKQLTPQERTQRRKEQRIRQKQRERTLAAVASHWPAEIHFERLYAFDPIENTKESIWLEKSFERLFAFNPVDFNKPDIWV